MAGKAAPPKDVAIAMHRNTSPRPNSEWAVHASTVSSPRSTIPAIMLNCVRGTASESLPRHPPTHPPPNVTHIRRLGSGAFNI